MALATPFMTLAIGRVTTVAGVASVVWQDGSFVDLTVTILPFTVFHPSPGVYKFNLDQAAHPSIPGTAFFVTCEPAPGPLPRIGCYIQTLVPPGPVPPPTFTTFEVHTFDNAAVPTDADFSFEVRLAPTQRT